MTEIESLISFLVISQICQRISPVGASTSIRRRVHQMYNTYLDIFHTVSLLGEFIELREKKTWSFIQFICGATHTTL